MSERNFKVGQPVTVYRFSGVGLAPTAIPATIVSTVFAAPDKYRLRSPFIVGLFVRHESDIQPRDDADGET